MNSNRDAASDKISRNIHVLFLKQKWLDARIITHYLNKINYQLHYHLHQIMLL
ncbi:hypothetical protein VAE151_550299 [Vibrio aestuarianus]|nr:hypothetical protein VAE055_370299 [Vibrio aestuarianus]CAH8206741.1 hypothetical protein VAE151_550299 [Vibrio aestuarianus]